MPPASAINRNWIDELRPHLGVALARYLEAALPRYQEDFVRVTNMLAPGASVLEVGSYPYCFTSFLAKAGYRVRGLDKKPDRGSAVLEKAALEILACDIETERFPIQDVSFDLVILNEVFEHLRIDPFYTLAEIRRCLKPGGRLLLSTPNLYGIRMVMKYLSGKGIEDPVEAFEMLRHTGHMGHLRTYSSANMRKFLEKSGYAVEQLVTRPVFTGSVSRRSLKRAIYTLIPRALHDNLVIVASPLGRT